MTTEIRARFPRILVSYLETPDSIYEPIKFDDNDDLALGWFQVVDDSGELLGFVNPDGDPVGKFDLHNRSWQLCELTDAHKESLAREAAPHRGSVHSVMVDDVVYRGGYDRHNPILIRTGTVLAKASKIDNEFQRFLVRDSLGELEYWHKQLCRWITLPSQWRRSVVWD